MSDRDQRLADLLARMTGQLQHGERLDLEQLGREHPDLIDELRELLPVAQLAEVLGRSAHSATTIAPPPDVVAAPSMPRRVGDYEIVAELGRGGMGVVYKAWDPQLRRHIALKMILQGELATSKDLSRFRGEAKAAAALSHPNIVPVYHVGECDGQAYFVMKFVEGQTLATLVQSGPLPGPRAARYVAQIARAVHYAHQKGILHRDLKPSNVLVDATDQPQITDFGLAKRVATWPPGADATGLTGTALTVTGAIVGTPSYMSPEQASGDPTRVGPASDIYSLGAILYALLTGRPPFQGGSLVDILLQVRSEEPIRPRLLSSRVDPDLEMIALKCLEKRPEYRYPSALALAEDLERYLHSEPVRARSSSLTYFLGRLFRETHHAPVMENWGILWMAHSVKIFLLCAITNVMHWNGVTTHPPYLALWSIGLVVWGIVFWQWRRRGGPVTFVERQMAHAWGAGVAASIGAFIVEVLLGLEVLTLTPVLAIMAGMIFIFQAGTLSGWFYIPAGLCFLSVFPMVWFPTLSQLLFGAITAFGFFVPGWQYYRLRHRARAATF